MNRESTGAACPLLGRCRFLSDICGNMTSDLFPGDKEKAEKVIREHRHYSTADGE